MHMPSKLKRNDYYFSRIQPTKDYHCVKVCEQNVNRQNTSVANTRQHRKKRRRNATQPGILR